MYKICSNLAGLVLLQTNPEKNSVNELGNCIWEIDTQDVEQTVCKLHTQRDIVVKHIILNPLAKIRRSHSGSRHGTNIFKFKLNYIYV